jgi:hypothetical protein
MLSNTNSFTVVPTNTFLMIIYLFQANGKVFEACVAQLNPDLQRALHQVLSAPAN